MAADDAREAARLERAMQRKGAARKPKTVTTTPTSSRNKCPICEKTVFQMEGIRAEQKLWHKACFKCATCERTQSLASYKAQDGIIYCQGCLPKLVSTPHGGLGSESVAQDFIVEAPVVKSQEQESQEAIEQLDNIVNTLRGESETMAALAGGSGGSGAAGGGRGGGTRMGPNGEPVRVANPLAKKDCSACKQPPREGEKMVTAKDNKYHLECWKCYGCNEQFTDGSAEKNNGTFISRDGNPYCDRCNHEGTCAGCGQFIRSLKYMEALGNRYHVNCLKCNDCGEVISELHTWEDQIYCKEHVPQAAKVEAARGKAPACAGCGEPIIGKAKKAVGKKWHKDCLICAGSCKEPLSGKTFYKFDESPYCGDCYRVAAAGAGPAAPAGATSTA